jgi:hypothetical protein
VAPPAPGFLKLRILKDFKCCVLKLRILNGLRCLLRKCVFQWSYLSQVASCDR